MQTYEKLGIPVTNKPGPIESPNELLIDSEQQSFAKSTQGTVIDASNRSGEVDAEDPSIAQEEGQDYYYGYSP